jgi:hypothetical protein
MTAAAIEAPLDLREQWRRWRIPGLIVVLVMGVAVALAAVENAPPQRPLDPRDASPVGARALAVLLQQRGITVTPTTTTAVDATGVTVFVPDPKSLTGIELANLNNSAANVVVVAPGRRELDALDADAQPAEHVSERTVDPTCAVPAATTAGDIKFSGATYSIGSALTGCYPADGGVGLVAIPRSEHFLVIVGSARVWTNERLGENGDAALALGLLASQPRLDWVLPRPPTQSPADREHKGLFALLPDRLLWALLQLIVVVLLIALWRGRRLGPVVAEPLPIVVPSAETVRGRARLLRAARARGAAAAELRTATVRRISDMLGLGPDAPSAAVVSAVTTRTDRSSNELQELLYGGEPHDDAALVSLAAALDDVELTMKGRA